MNLRNRYDINGKPIKVVVCVNCGHEVRADSIPDEVPGLGKVNPLTMIRTYMTGIREQACCEKPKYRFVLRGTYETSSH